MDRKINKRGSFEVGQMLVVFVGVVVALALFIAIAQGVGSATNTITLANTTIDTPANGTAYVFTAYQSLSNVVVYNGTSLVASGNYTVANNQLVNGQLVSTITPDASGSVGAPYDWNISATAEPVGYISNSAGRSIATIIPLLTALALAIMVLVPSTRGYLAEMLGK